MLAQTWVQRLVRGPQAHVEAGRRRRPTSRSPLDDNDSDVHRVLAAVNLALDEHEKAKYHQERALGLNPNNDLILVQQGELLTWLGRPEDGIEWIRKAMRVNPYHPERFWNHLGRAHYTARQYSEAVAAL